MAGYGAGALPVDLLAIARSHGWKNFGLSLVAIVLGVIVTLVGVAVFLFVPVGVLLVLGGLIMAPISLWHAIDPMSHEALRGLGRTPLERANGVKHVEWELAQPSAWHVRMSSGTLVVTPSWMIHHTSSSLVLVRRADVVWYWETVERGRYGSTSHYLSLHTWCSTKAVKFPMLAGTDHHLWAVLQYAFPFALVGYQYKDVPITSIAAEVARRAAAATPPGPYRGQIAAGVMAAG